jgi:hypothetical protein
VEAGAGAHRAHSERSFEELDIADVDIDDPAFEALLVGRKVKVLLGDVDLHPLEARPDRGPQPPGHAARRSPASHAARDDKLLQAARIIAREVPQPHQPGNRKVIVFTAFADTASTSTHLRPGPRPSWASIAALVTGSGRNQTTCRICARPEQHPHRVFAALQGAPGRLADEGESTC